LEDGKAGNVVTLDVAESLGWTDFFIIATVSSGTHSEGLQRQIKDHLKALGDKAKVAIHVPHRKMPDGPEWSIVDLGSIVVHLMAEETRSFYELEKLCAPLTSAEGAPSAEVAQGVAEGYAPD
jgi:ribosome-associated protein